jgi:hypothetical protein
VLTLELAHLRALGEAELRLRRDLVEELLAGTDAESAQGRARALGYDLARPHRVVLVTNGRQRVDHEAFFHAVRRAVRATGAGSLLAARPGGVAVLCDTDQDWEQFRAAIIAWSAGATTTSPPRRCHCIAAPCATGCNGFAICLATTSTTPTPGSTYSSPPGPGQPCTPCATSHSSSEGESRRPRPRPVASGP